MILTPLLNITVCYTSPGLRLGLVNPRDIILSLSYHTLQCKGEVPMYRAPWHLPEARGRIYKADVKLYSDRVTQSYYSK